MSRVYHFKKGKEMDEFSWIHRNAQAWGCFKGFLNHFGNLNLPSRVSHSSALIHRLGVLPFWSSHLIRTIYDSHQGSYSEDLLPLGPWETNINNSSLSLTVTRQNLSFVQLLYLFSDPHHQSFNKVTSNRMDLSRHSLSGDIEQDGSRGFQVNWYLEIGSTRNIFLLCMYIL